MKQELRHSGQMKQELRLAGVTNRGDGYGVFQLEMETKLPRNLIYNKSASDSGGNISLCNELLVGTVNGVASDTELMREKTCGRQLVSAGPCTGQDLLDDLVEIGRASCRERV